jgi:hypothetical protein
MAVNALRFAEQTTARTFLVNDGRGTAEVQINRGDRKLLQCFRRANERRNVVADQLRNDGLAGGILFDGFENPLLWSRDGMNAKVFRPVNIRTPVTMHQIPERGIGHILHRREREEGRGAAEQVVKLRHSSNCDHVI